MPALLVTIRNPWRVDSVIAVHLRDSECRSVRVISGVNLVVGSVVQLGYSVLD